MNHITVIDKDRGILNMLKTMLQGEGFHVESHTDPLRALQSMRQRKTDLAVMEMNMPRMDGLSLLERIKAEDSLNVPVVLLSADHDNADEIMVLRMGAGDFMHKPFAPRVLLERVRNCLKRAEIERLVSKEQGKIRKQLVRGDLTLDPDTLRVQWKDQDVRLTAKEFEMLYFLAEKPDFVRSRQQVMDRVYGPGVFVEERVVDSHLKRVRKKISAVDPGFSSIETVYGVGYRFVGPKT